MRKDGSDYTILHHFGPAAGDGLSPGAGLLEGSDGALYGTTLNSGQSDYGTVFKLNKDGSGYAVLHRFGSALDGVDPYAALIEGSDGRLYGTTSGGGELGIGTVYALRPASPALLSVYDVTGTEGDQPTTNVVFVLRLSTPQLGSVSVDFATADCTARAGSDYVAATGTSVFAPGETNKIIVIPVMGDLLLEGDETLFLNLSNPRNSILLTSQSRGTILDDDSPPAITKHPQNHFQCHRDQHSRHRLSMAVQYYISGWLHQLDTHDYPHPTCPRRILRCRGVRRRCLRFE